MFALSRIGGAKSLTMNRLFSILVSLFILFLVYLWINHITNMDKAVPQIKKEQASRPVPNDRTTKVTPEASDPSSEKKADQNIEKPATQEKKVEEPSRKKNKSRTSAINDGTHLVVAGNFLERTNAEKHLKSIKDLGYSDAEILNFEISQYYTVIAGRYIDLAEARRVAKRLKDLHSVDTYVRNGN